MRSEILVDSSFDLREIMTLGGINPDAVTYGYSEGKLFIENTQDLQDELEAGLAAYAYEPVLDSISWDQIRVERCDKLCSSDWTQVADSALVTAKIDEWKVYRQALRDLPQTYTDPDDVVWPVEPA